jgi:hypothetical protein
VDEVKVAVIAPILGRDLSLVSDVDPRVRGLRRQLRGPRPPGGPRWSGVDSMEIINLDRMIGATGADVWLARSKVEVAARLMALVATAELSTIAMHDLSLCEPAGLAAALDYDIIISCVDRPWARGILNPLAFADLVPVLDGGIGIDTFDDGQMRNAVWRSHLLVPGELAAAQYRPVCGRSFGVVVNRLRGAASERPAPRPGMRRAAFRSAET